MSQKKIPGPAVSLMTGCILMGWRDGVIRFFLEGERSTREYAVGCSVVERTMRSAVWDPVAGTVPVLLHTVKKRDTSFPFLLFWLCVLSSFKTSPP